MNNSEVKNNLAQTENFMPSAPPSYDEVIAAQNVVGMTGTAGTAFVSPPQPSIPVGGVVMPVIPPGNIVYSHPVPPLVQTINVGPSRAHLQCPQCSKNVKTCIETSYQKTAHIACFVLCLVGCGLCSCIPYCLNSFKNIHHKCPECKAYIGTFKH